VERDVGRRIATPFLVLILAQTAHSAEEYKFRLFDVLLPARYLSRLLSDDPAVGFAIANAALVGFGLWCYFARVRPGDPSARSLAWFWAVLEFANGVGHGALAAWRGGYFPGVATAPLLVGAAVYLSVRLSSRAQVAPSGP
jgi:hypothetical protein